MSISKKHFTAIAEAIAWTIGQDMSDNPAHDTMDYLLDELSYQLSRLNPAFDEDKFREYIDKRSKEIVKVINETELELANGRR
jgi:hypothetical protein